jgi:hypothetical protein
VLLFQKLCKLDWSLAVYCLSRVFEEGETSAGASLRLTCTQCALVISASFEFSKGRLFLEILLSFVSAETFLMHF